MAKGFLKGTASLTNGSKIMTLDDNTLDASYVTSGSHIELDGFMTVEGIGGTVGEITLREPWDQPDQTNLKFVVTYTIEGLVDAVERSRVISEEWQQAVKDVDDVVASAVDASDRLDALEPRITQAEQDLSTIEGTLDAKVQAASLSENNAATSETNSANSASAAALDADRAEAAFDNFDDKYLGAKPSDPTVDNDGNALQVGASYWNTVEDELRYWNGATWDRPEETATQAATSATASKNAAAISETNAANDAAQTSQDRIATGNDATQTASDRVATSDDASSASADALTATNAANQSAANANYKGEWSSLSGALNIPASVKDGNFVYMLNENLADVTLWKPADNPDKWFVLGSVSGVAPDSERLNGQLPSFYATKEEVDEAQLLSLGGR